MVCVKCGELTVLHRRISSQAKRLLWRSSAGSLWQPSLWQLCLLNRFQSDRMTERERQEIVKKQCVQKQPSVHHLVINKQWLRLYYWLMSCYNYITHSDLQYWSGWRSEVPLFNMDKFTEFSNWASLTREFGWRALLVHILLRSVSLLSGWKPPSHWSPGIFR